MSKSFVEHLPGYYHDGTIRSDSRCASHHITEYAYHVDISTNLLVSVFSALRVFALMNRGALVAGLVLVLSLVPLATNGVSEDSYWVSVVYHLRLYSVHFQQNYPSFRR